MDTITVFSTVLAAVAAALSAVSAVASLRSTRAVEKEVELGHAATRYELFRSYEDVYARMYPVLWETLGPWEDDVPVDPALRRAVHDLLQTLSSIYAAEQLGLFAAPAASRAPTTILAGPGGTDLAAASHSAELFLDWLRLPRARAVWREVFAVQTAAWPKGFVAWVDAQLGPDAGAETR